MFAVEFTIEWDKRRRSEVSTERIAGCELGAAIVEFALALPGLLLIVVGTAQFGHHAEDERRKPDLRISAEPHASKSNDRLIG